MRLQTAEYLLVKINRYYATADWTEKKLDVLVEVPAIDLSQLRAPSQRPAGRGGAARRRTSQGIRARPRDISTVTVHGFDENGCKRACSDEQRRAGGRDEWVFSHMDDADFRRLR